MRRVPAYDDALPSSRRRRQRMVLAAAGALVGVLLLALGVAGPALAASPPPLTILTAGANNSNGDLFISPYGAKAPYSNGVEITNTAGEVIWFHAAPAGQEDTDFRAQTYEGQPVLTFWQGTGFGGLDKGTDYIYNDHFEQIATVNAGNGYSADGHEFLITPQNTALILVNATATADLTSIGGSAAQTVDDGLVQEINISTGQVLFQWDSDGSVPFAASFEALPKSPSTAWDWFHINAVKIDSDGNLIIDGRNTWAFYKVNRTTGEVIWTLGGKDSSFTEEAAAGQVLNNAGDIFAWQHAPEPLGDNEYSVFDDEAAGAAQLSYSRVEIVQLNPLTNTATLVSSFEQPQSLRATSQGNAQIAANGDTVAGWGNLPYVSESNSSDELLWEAEFPSGVNTYRAYREPWLSGATTEASVSPSTTTAGGSVTYSATVSSPASPTPTGTVTFTSGATTLCTTEALVSGAGSCSASDAPVGSDTITATYSGDSSFASSSGTTSLTVNEAPAITSAGSTLFTEGAAGSFTVTATGTPAPAITETGALPNGVTFNGGVLSGTPTQDGVYQISFEAANGVGSGAVQSFTLTVNSKPAITSSGKATFTEGAAGSFTVTATGAPSPTVTESGTLPNGVTFSGGVLSGTPTQGGVYAISFTATNAAGSATQSFTLTVDAPAAITSASKATFNQGVAGTFTVLASGTPAPAITEFGSLPAGVTFSNGVFAGTPTIQGTFYITLIATNGIGSPSYQLFTLTVVGLHITTASLPGVQAGGSYSLQLTAAGGQAPYKWKLTGGPLPRGLKLSKTGLISGTVKANAETYPYAVGITVSDSSKTDPQSAEQNYTIVVSPASDAAAVRLRRANHKKS